MTDHTLLQHLTIDNTQYDIHNISLLTEKKIVDITTLPFSARVLIENMARHMDNTSIQWSDIVNAARFYADAADDDQMIAYYPSRVLMQDFTGVPAVVDLAAMRDAVAKAGLDPERINPQVPVDLVIDHSIQVDHYREQNAFILNAKKEYERNKERYQLLKWAQKSFQNFSVVPPESGICHQVNLEYLSKVVATRNTEDGILAFPDTLVGTDSHTTMINALGVLGWGVGGIEAEAVMLGQPYYMNLPQIIGVKLTGKPAKQVTATDIVLHITQVLRQENVVEKIVEYTGEGLKHLSLTDRATIANMAPEYGATAGFFPVDELTLEYLETTHRSQAAKRTESYCRTCSFFNTYDNRQVFSKTIDVDLSQIETVVAGPSRPQDKIVLSQVKARTQELFGLDKIDTLSHDQGTKKKSLQNGSIVIAAITSCTNTSNPHTMIGAGLVAKNAVEKGLSVPWYVKTSLAPGSKVVIDYLKNADLLVYFEQLGFNNTGFGCTTCIGNSGPLDSDVETAIDKNNLDVMSVLSGNRNFEARIHQKVKGNFLMSPILVVIYAIAGRIDIDLKKEPLGVSKDGSPVFMDDIWPEYGDINALVDSCVKTSFFQKQYNTIFKGDALWQELEVKESTTFKFDETSTYIQNPPFFQDFSLETATPEDIQNARPLLVLGDSVTTDHISPAGAIPAKYPAGRYLIEHGVNSMEFNSYGSRRGNHEVMMRGTFANIRIKNNLVSDTGGVTLVFPEKTEEYVFDASEKYRDEQTDLIVFGGKEYGTGSSRDWAAKGTRLLGIKAVIARSFERIHRSNLVGMGVLPLVFKEGETLETLGLTGEEIFDITGLDKLQTNCLLDVTAGKDGHTTEFQVIAKLNTQIEIDYIKHGGILPYVLRQLIAG